MKKTLALRTMRRRLFVTTMEDTAVTLLDNVSELVSTTNGTSTLSGGVITFTPTLNFFGHAYVKYKTETGEVRKKRIYVKAINDAPVATNDTFSVVKNTTTTFDVLANDTDVEGDEITIISATATGTVTIVDNKLEYTPVTDFVGTDTINYSISAHNIIDTATATITITTE